MKKIIINECEKLNNIKIRGGVCEINNKQHSTQQKQVTDEVNAKKKEKRNHESI